jgi:hypothetical protein
MGFPMINTIGVFDHIDRTFRDATGFSMDLKAINLEEFRLFRVEKLPNPYLMFNPRVWVFALTKLNVGIPAELHDRLTSLKSIQEFVTVKELRPENPIQWMFDYCSTCDMLLIALPERETVGVVDVDDGNLIFTDVYGSCDYHLVMKGARMFKLKS